MPTRLTGRLLGHFSFLTLRGTAEKAAIFGALSLYLDFVNLFQFLMSFMGQSRDD
jgi:FtsH-binding integral membrane protein